MTKHKTVWDVVPKDYRSKVKGKKYVLVYDANKHGTMLVPVNSKEAKETWGKYLPQNKKRFLK